MPNVPNVPNWRTDQRAQAMMSLLVAAGVAMYRKRASGELRAAGGRGLAARTLTPPTSTVSRVSAAAGASHPALINHETA